jgi:RNA polymerase sigma-70 factor (ECF subfamily)
VADARRAVAAAALPPARANGQPALGVYLFDAGAYVPLVLDVLTLRGELIAAVTAFRTPAVFARFGLPSRL